MSIRSWDLHRATSAIGRYYWTCSPTVNRYPSLPKRVFLVATGYVDPVCVYAALRMPLTPPFATHPRSTMLALGSCPLTPASPPPQNTRTYRVGEVFLSSPGILHPHQTFRHSFVWPPSPQSHHIIPPLLPHAPCAAGSRLVPSRPGPLLSSGPSVRFHAVSTSRAGVSELV